jgi:hypothetical protein
MGSEMTERLMGRRQLGCGGERSRKLQAAQGRLSGRAEGEERAKRLRWLERRGRTQRDGTAKETFGEGMKGRRGTEDSK